MASDRIVETAEGVKLNCRVDGPDGAPWVTLSNSLITDLTMWDDFTAAVSDRFRVLRYDQRGHGKSPATPAPYSIPGLARDVVALWDRLGIARSHVVGVSMGGATALSLEIDFPDRLLSAVVCDCRDDMTGGRADWDARLAKARLEGIATMIEPTVQRWFAPQSLAAGIPAIGRIGKMIAGTTLEGYAGCIDALTSCNLSTHTAGIKVPTLLVVGESDGVVAPMRALGEKIPGSQFAIVPDAGHLPMIENPIGFNRIVTPFLDSFRSS